MLLLKQKLNMKNINRYKLVPVLVIGLVLSAFNAMAEVKTVSSIGNDQPIIKIQEGEVGTCVFIMRTNISIKTEKEHSVWKLALLKEDRC